MMRYGILFQQFDYLLKELKKPGVTLELLWQEYKQRHPEGYAYSQFCYHFQVWRGLSSLTRHIEHKAGETMFVDYTGKKLTITDELTGKVRKEFLEIIVPDCLRSAVTKANRYEPDINPLYADFARHYGAAIVSARPGSPQGKGRRYQIFPTATRFGFAKAKVEVQRRLDGTIHIFYKEEELSHKPIMFQEKKRYAPSHKEALAVGV